MRSLSLLTLVGATALVLCGCAAPRPVTMSSLLSEMCDLGRLPEFPDPPFTCRQFSSYDRRSTTPADHDSWFANHDANQYLRVEERDGRKEYVMMDADGPGAIVRIWSANPKGTLRIYLDRREKPVLELPMRDLLSGKLTTVPAALAGEHSAGWNCYLPIPYARHCKVTSDADGFYYHVNYRTYPRGTPVTTFQTDDLGLLASQIADIAQRLSKPRDCGLAPTAPVGCKITQLPQGRCTLGPGQMVEAWRCSNERGQSRAITDLQVRVEAADRERALREVALLLQFDEQPPTICPLGDFFGAGVGAAAYESLPMGITPDGILWSHWVMPFRKTARIELRNTGLQPTVVTLSAATSEYQWTGRTMYFYAGWRVARDVPTRPFCDWNYVRIRGGGVFVGAAFAITNPVRHWWGEGDEKIYVDGEGFPSHFGTGTEDYYGYAWGNNRPFTHAYHNQPRCDGPGTYGHTAVNRWHISDRIPFQRDFRFDMELWHWWEGAVPEMSVMTYWYGRPGTRALLPPLTDGDLRLTRLPPYKAPRVAGALEGEEMTIVAKTGDVGPQEIADSSNDNQLWWRGGQVGDQLRLRFPAPAAGNYRVFGRFVKAQDYGIVRLSINGVPAAEPIDLYDAKISLSGEMLLGTYSLQAQDNELTVEIVGANEKTLAGQYMFGLDYLRVEPAE